LWRDAEGAVSDAHERGVQLEVRSDEGAYHFPAPISLIFDRWIAEVEAALGKSLDARRWRPNLLAHAAPNFALSENDLSGRSINAGDVVLRVVKPIKRCVVPTYDLDGGASDPEVMAFVIRERANVMGFYCEVELPGDVRVDDALICREL
jgi:uncharacterized protein YcbX